MRASELNQVEGSEDRAVQSSLPAHHQSAGQSSRHQRREKGYRPRDDGPAAEEIPGGG